MAAKRIVVLACGNRSRGDDALGPTLLDRIEAAQLDDVRTIEAYQFNIEHALDIEDADLALFVDAGQDTTAPFTFCEVVASQSLSHSTHALEPSDVLATYRKINGRPHPAAYCLCVGGRHFDLGAPLSREAAANLELAAAFLLQHLERVRSS